MAVRVVPGLIAVTALMGLAACGSVSASSVSGGTVPAGTVSAGSVPAGTVSAGSVPAGGAGGSLCADGRSADRVAVSQSNSARHVTRTSATQVQALIAALCALPALPAGQHCVASGSVRLVFAAQDQSFPPVTVQQAGCWTVSGIGTTRWWSASSHFAVLLDEAVGGLGRLAPGVHPSSVPTGP